MDVNSAVHLCAPFVSKDQTRPELAHVYVDGGYVHATDGHRAVMVRTDQEGEHYFGPNGHQLGGERPKPPSVREMMPGPETPLALILDKGMVDALRDVVKLVAPKVVATISFGMNQTNLHLETKGKRAARAILTVPDMALVRPREFTVTERYPTTIRTGREVENVVSVNLRYLVDALDVVPPRRDEWKLRQTDPLAPIYIGNGEVETVTMPVRV